MVSHTREMFTCILKNKLIFGTWNTRRYHLHVNMMLLMGMFFLNSANAVFFISQSFVLLFLFQLICIPPVFFFMSDNLFLLKHNLEDLYQLLA